MSFYTSFAVYIYCHTISSFSLHIYSSTTFTFSYPSVTRKEPHPQTPSPYGKVRPGENAPGTRYL